MTTTPYRGFMKACGWRHYRTGSQLRVFWNEFYDMEWLRYLRVSKLHSRLLFMFRAYLVHLGAEGEIFIEKRSLRFMNSSHRR
jgi:hypothetical protein